MSPLVLGCPAPGGGSDTTSTSQPPPEEVGDLAACTALPEASAAGWEVGESLEPTGMSTPERLAMAGEGTWELALDLLRATDPSRSVATSPAALSVAMGMAKTEYEGQECGASIQARMHFTEEGDALHQTLGASIRTLQQRALEATEDEDPVSVVLQPSIWDLTDSRVPLPTYGGTVHSVNGEFEAIRTVMNCAIEVQSQGLMTDFVPPGLPANDTTSLDVSVAYLQAPWEDALDGRGPVLFSRDDGTEDSLPAMGGWLVAGILQDDQRWALELPLRGGELNVLLVVPAPQMPTDMESFAAGMTAEELTDIREGLRWAGVDLTMPTIDIPSETIDYYERLGLECPPFTLRTVLHGAAVQMDEKGVRAAAATTVEHWTSGGEVEELIDVRLDRPFLFFVYDRSTNFVLFSGRFTG